MEVVDERKLLLVEVFKRPINSLMENLQSSNQAVQNMSKDILDQSARDLFLLNEEIEKCNRKFKTKHT